MCESDDWDVEAWSFYGNKNSDLSRQTVAACSRWREWWHLKREVCEQENGRASLACVPGAQGRVDAADGEEAVVLMRTWPSCCGGKVNMLRSDPGRFAELAAHGAAAARPTRPARTPCTWTWQECLNAVSEYQRMPASYSLSSERKILYLWTWLAKPFSRCACF